MTVTAILFGIAVLVASALLTALVRRFALAHGVLDVPNARSSHQRVIPRGGGTAVVVTTSAAVVGLLQAGVVSPDLSVALLGGGITVAAVGFLDDRYSLRPGVRLAVHLLAATWAVYWLGGLNSVRVGDQLAELGWAGDALAVLGIAWVLNLFNFMDGIDGIATSEALFVAGAGALLCANGQGGVPVAAAVFACSCAGFLIWNWPPGRIFLGDVGSCYLGYVIAVLALASSRYDPVAIWVWLILGGVFLVDATVTLARRLLRGERLHEAHRSHAYQYLARRWGSHTKVTIAVLAIDVTWLLPCAVLATVRPTYAAAIVAVALLPLVVLSLLCGSGLNESKHG